MKFLSDILAKAGLIVDGATTLNTIAGASTNTDKILVSDGGVVKYRTAAQVLTDIGGVSGTGTSGYLPKFTGSTTIGNSLVYDNGTGVGVNTTTITSGYLLNVNGLINAATPTSSTLHNIGGIEMGLYDALKRLVGNHAGGFYIYNTLGVVSINSAMTVHTSGEIRFNNNQAGLQYIKFQSGSTINTNNGYGLNFGLTIGADGTNAMKIFTGGNIAFQTGGTYTDAGYKVDVIGSARITKELIVNSDTTTATYPLVVTSNTTSGYAAQFKHPSTYNTYIGISPVAIVFSNSSLNPVSISATVSDLSLIAPQTATITFRTGGTSDYRPMVMSQTGILVNPSLTSFMDFTVYGDTNANLFCVDVSADNIGIGTNAPTASSILEISSTTKGFLPPRMTAAQKGAISTPATGLIIYQTDGTSGLYVYTGSAWKALAIVA